MTNRFSTWLDSVDKKTLPFWSEVDYLGSALDTRRPFFAKVALSAVDGMTVWITNFVVLWTESLTRAEVETRLKDLNPSLEADADVMMNEIREVLLDRRRSAKTNVHGKLDGRRPPKIEFKTKFDDLPLRWETKLEISSPEEFFDQLTKPLLASISQYQRRETALFDLLAAKDQEIDQRRIGSRSQGREQKVNETPKFRSRDWSTNDQRCKDFLKLQQNLRPETLTRNLVSNDLYGSVSAAALYLRENSEVSSDEDGSVGSPDNVAEANRRQPVGTSYNDAVLDLPDETAETSRTQPSPRATAREADTDEREPSPPSPPTQRKKKRLRL